MGNGWGLLSPAVSLWKWLWKGQFHKHPSKNTMGFTLLLTFGQQCQTLLKTNPCKNKVKMKKKKRYLKNKLFHIKQTGNWKHTHIQKCLPPSVQHGNQLAEAPSPTQASHCEGKMACGKSRGAPPTDKPSLPRAGPNRNTVLSKSPLA